MKEYALSVDLGGTHLRTALIERSGEIVSVVRYRTKKDVEADVLIDQIIEALEEVCGKDQLKHVVGVGLAVPGLVDTQEGSIIRLPNIPALREIPIVSIIGNKLKKPVYIGNDANLATLGEYTYGAGRGFHDVIYITVSTGIGGGIIINDQLLEGAHGMSSEMGHIPLLIDGPLCRCGHHGHFEAFASGTAIAQQATYGIMDRKDSILNRVPEITTKEVVNAAKNGDALAMRVLKKAGSYLGIGIVTLVHIFDPERIIIGGGVSNAGDLLLDPAKETVSEKVLFAYHDHFDIVLNELGDNPGLMGGAALAFRAFDKKAAEAGKTEKVDKS